MNNLGRNFLIGGLIGLAVGQMNSEKSNDKMMNKARWAMKRTFRILSNVRKMI